MAKKSKNRQREQKQIDSLDELVGHLYIKSIRNHVYQFGELDYVGILPNGKWDIYEVKSSRSGHNRAMQQLYIAKRYFWKKCNNQFIYFHYDRELKKVNY